MVYVTGTLKHLAHALWTSEGAMIESVFHQWFAA
jgi:hypothetical protein